MKPIEVFWNGADKVVSFAEDWAMAALLAAASCLGIFQIILRYGFSAGFDWVEAFLIMFVVYAALIGASVAVRRNVHVKLDVLVQQAPQRVQWGIQLVTHLLCLFYTCALWVFGVQFVMQTIRFDNMNILSDLPEWVHYMAGPIGLGLMSIRYLQEIVKLVVVAPAQFGRKDA